MTFRLAMASRTHQRIKAFYLSRGRGRTEQQWQAIAADLQQFNRVWRAMLQLPPDDTPPPPSCR